jgi:hypothetical protein
MYVCMYSHLKDGNCSLLLILCSGFYHCYKCCHLWKAYSKCVHTFTLYLDSN